MRSISEVGTRYCEFMRYNKREGRISDAERGRAENDIQIRISTVKRRTYGNT